MSAARGRMLRRLAALVAITGLVIWSVWRWHRQPRLRQLSGTTMGTYFDLKIVLPAGGGWDDLKMGDLAADIEECLKDVNAKMSTYIPDSELSRFNRHPDASPVKASPELLDVLLLAREISELSGGAFDITVGPIVNAYGFGPVARRDRLPADDELEALRDRVGFRKLVIDEAAGTIAKQRPDIYCDLSAIAKGYGVDRVADLLEERGIADYMVEIGGEVRARGRNQDGRPWRIGVQKPVDDPLGEHLGVQRILELTGAAVATSGDYRNFVLDEGGRRISHSIDPRTGRPVAHDLASVTVIDERCARADALATALLVLGPDEGYHLAERSSIAALFLLRRTGGALESRETAAFSEKVRAPGEMPGE